MHATMSTPTVANLIASQPSIHSTHQRRPPAISFLALYTAAFCNPSHPDPQTSKEYEQKNSRPQTPDLTPCSLPPTPSLSLPASLEIQSSPLEAKPQPFISPDKQCKKVSRIITSKHTDKFPTSHTRPPPPDSRDRAPSPSPQHQPPFPTSVQYAS